MFTRRKLKTNWEDKMDNFQARNRQAVRHAENKVLTFAGAVFLILVLSVSIAGAITQPVAEAQELVEVSEEPQPIVIQSINPEVYPVKIGASEFQNEMIKYAWGISGKDFDFIKLIESESGWVVDAVGVNSGGSRDYGLCQINSYFHSQIVNDPKFNDWRWEIDTCYQMYEGGVTFYGIHRINEQALIDNFKFISK